ncbi:MAG: PilZ domain-containing protein [Oscillospiraceae bacterium]
MYQSIAAGYKQSICEVTTDTNEMITVGLINEVEKDFIRVVPKSGDMRLVKTGTDVKISIHNAKLGFTVVLGQVLTSTRREMKIVNLIQIVSHERRTYFRVELELKAKLAPTRDALAEDSVSVFTVVVRDLSLCGMRFESVKELELGETMWTELHIEERAIVTPVRIIRRISEDFARRLTYGGEFIAERGGDNDRLCAYLFKKQRELANRNR